MEKLKPLSKKDKDEKLIEIRRMRDEAVAAAVDWCTRARVAYAFKAGQQWSHQELEALKLQGRKPMVWNYIHPQIELAMGVLAQNPLRIYPTPVEPDDGFLCKVLEDLITWVDANSNDTESEYQNCYEDMLITGRGFIAVDVGPSPDNPDEIDIREDALDVCSVFHDPAANKEDLSDARYILYEKWLSVEDFQVRYPNHANKVSEWMALSRGNSQSFGWLAGTEEWMAELPGYNDYSTPMDYYDYEHMRILVTHLEYREYITKYFMTNPDGTKQELDKDQLALLKKANPDAEIVSIGDVVYKWIHFTYDAILWEGESPVFDRGYSIVPMCAYPDRSKGAVSYFGLVELMMYPQQECNRRWMQIIKLMERQGIGLIAEVDAFLDVEQAAQTWNDPDAITFMNSGAIVAGKFREKSSLEIPAASASLEQASQDAMKRITGINPDLLGMAQQRQEPGVVVRLRQKQGMTILARLLRNYKRALKQLYMRKLFIISKYMPDAQIIKILGSGENYVFENGMIIDQERQLSAPIRSIRDLVYNIRIEDAPGNMTRQMADLSVYMELLGNGFPVDPKVVVGKLDISPADKADWIKFIESGQAQQSQQAEMAAKAQQEEMQSKLQFEHAKIQLEIAKLKLEEAKIQSAHEIKMRELAIKASIAQSDVEMDQARLQLEAADQITNVRKISADITERVAKAKAAEKEADLSRLERLSQWQ